MFGCFHKNQLCVTSCYYFSMWEVLQEVGNISMVRPYIVSVKSPMMIKSVKYWSSQVFPS